MWSWYKLLEVSISMDVAFGMVLAFDSLRSNTVIIISDAKYDITVTLNSDTDPQKFSTYG